MTTHTAPVTEEFKYLPIEVLVESPTNPRQTYNEEKLKELAASIFEEGILQPLLVRPTGDFGENITHEIVFGSRRYRAAKMAALDTVPVRVKLLNTETVVVIQNIENLQREDLHPIEEAHGYRTLMQHGHHMEELEARVGKSRSYIYGRLKLLDLCKPLRKRFAADEFSPSIALLLARIPGEKLQLAAAKEIVDRHWGQMSYREAKEHVEENYMLVLSAAPFKTEDPVLLPNVGPCGSCPKRTGNALDLFGDVGRADVCTDPACYRTKVRAQGNRTAEEWRKAGKPVIPPKQAKEIARWGIDSSLLDGNWVKVDKKVYVPATGRHRSAGNLAKDAERHLLQDPETGQAIQIIKSTDLDKVMRKRENGTTAMSTNPSEAQARRKHKIEKAYRKQLYLAIRPNLVPTSLTEIARELVAGLSSDEAREVCAIRGFKPPKQKYGSPDYRAFAGDIDTLGPPELQEIIHDCIHAKELVVYTYQVDAKPEKMLREAKALDLDPAAIRRTVTAAHTPKKKAKPKAKKARAKK